MMGLDSNQMYIASVVATYWFVSISMVYLNKVLMSNEGISIPAPLFVTWFQCVVTTGICYAAGEVGEHFKKRDYQAVRQSEDGSEGGSETPANKPSFFAQFPKAEYKIGTGQKILPLRYVPIRLASLDLLALTPYQY
jgi:GDP-fucose transporter C1